MNAPRIQLAAALAAMLAYAVLWLLTGRPAR